MFPESHLVFGLLTGFAVAALGFSGWGWRYRRQLLLARQELAQAESSDSPAVEVISEPVVAPDAVSPLEEECRRLRAQAAVLESELGALMYSVSHDLRAPIRGIDGFSQALIEDYAPQLDGTAKTYLARVRANAATLNAQIEDLLTLSRVARASFHPERLDFTAMARGIAADLASAEPARTVRWDIPADLTATGDRMLLIEATRQLLCNAWKFTAPRDLAEIAARVLPADPAFDDGPVYEISDNGVGFDLQYAGRLFGAFQRMHSVEEFPAGRGIGLALVQRIVNRHGGRIWVDTGLGKGTRFSFTLQPARVAASATARPNLEIRAPVPVETGATSAPLAKITIV